MTESDDARRLAEQLAGEMTAEQQQALLQTFLAGGLPEMFGLEDPLQVQDPEVGEAPSRVRGFRVRLDLLETKPPVWRRLELPGDVTLEQLHAVIQAAMGWLDCHLHRFRTGSDPRSPYFVTPFDVDEGETGVLEGDVRLDQMVGTKGDRLWYDYDFGDDWNHVIKVEAVLDEPPAEARCTGGRLACPPEDCGGTGSYEGLATWVRDGCPPSSVPMPFEDVDHARDWLPLDWHPDRFDVTETDQALAGLLADPVPVAEGLATLRDRLERVGDRSLSRLLTQAASQPTGEVDEGEAARLLEPLTTLLSVIGDDGVRLTAAGKLPPALVEQLAEETGASSWLIGKANREDQTWPVALLRERARALGLVTVRKGLLSPTAVARRHGDKPLALWRHVVSRLEPSGRDDFDREAGWLSLAVVASGAPAEEWMDAILSLLLDLDWRVRGPSPERVPVFNPTLDTLEVLAGKVRHDDLTGVDEAVVATARAVVLKSSPHRPSEPA